MVFILIFFPCNTLIADETEAKNYHKNIISKQFESDECNSVLCKHLARKLSLLVTAYDDDEFEYPKFKKEESSESGIVVGEDLRIKDALKPF